MPRLVVLGAAVADVLAWSAFCLFGFDLTGDLVAAEAAINEFARECECTSDQLSVTQPSKTGVSFTPHIRR